ncbi:MAG: hypothetical protein ACP59X_22725 [Solidesulfovibrio sp. DCME]|uniref:hypothetical protein n=1 Tax=Solidesulfovibrio sp. DCME TaxID=3447380 RepID=UPI003D13F0DE
MNTPFIRSRIVALRRLANACRGHAAARFFPCPRRYCAALATAAPEPPSRSPLPSS